MIAAYYNEIDAFAAQWLRNLIAAGHIAPGEVDTRSIAEVQPDDVRGFTQVHFFAGIGGWSHALRLVGWPDDRPIWTGSCPCQPFSAAGRQQGTADERHLWPEMRRLLAECRPPVVAGEQVASALGRDWLAAVRADLEALGYAVGAADLCAASVGAPHIRQRLWWVADADRERRDRQHALLRTEEAGWVTVGVSQAAGGCGPDGMAGRAQGMDERPEHGGAGVLAQPAEPGPQGRPGAGERPDAQQPAAERGGAVGLVAQPEGVGRVEAGLHAAGSAAAYSVGQGRDRHGDGSAAGHWSDLAWLPCRDGKARPTQPGLQPLAHGVSGRVGRLRAYGNAIVPQVAAEFIGAVMECRP